MGNDLPGHVRPRGPFRLKFGWPVVLTEPRLSAAPQASQSSASADPSSLTRKHLERRRARAAPGRAAFAFALASAGIARGFLGHTTSRSSGQLCMLSSHGRAARRRSRPPAKASGARRPGAHDGGASCADSQSARARERAAVQRFDSGRSCSKLPLIPPCSAPPHA